MRAPLLGWASYPWFSKLVTSLTVETSKRPLARSAPTMQDTLLRNPWAQAVLATIITIGFFIAMFVPGVWQGFVVDEALKQTLQNLFILVIGYYFGSSSSSAKKDDVIATQAKTAGVVASDKIDDANEAAK